VHSINGTCIMGRLRGAIDCRKFSICLHHSAHSLDFREVVEQDILGPCTV
jgi:hypothetical protein